MTKIYSGFRRQKTAKNRAKKVQDFDVK